MSCPISLRPTEHPSRAPRPRLSTRDTNPPPFMSLQLSPPGKPTGGLEIVLTNDLFLFRLITFQSLQHRGMQLFHFAVVFWFLHLFYKANKEKTNPNNPNDNNNIKASDKLLTHRYIMSLKKRKNKSSGFILKQHGAAGEEEVAELRPGDNPSKRPLGTPQDPRLRDKRRRWAMCSLRAGEQAQGGRKYSTVRYAR